VLPAENEHDLDELPTETKRELDFVLADTIEQVFEVAFDGAVERAASAPLPAIGRRAARAG